LVTLLSYGMFWAVSISPEKFWLAGFVAYLVPFALLANVGFMIFWLIFGKWKALLSLVVLLVGAKHVKSSYSFASKNEYAVKSEGDFDVMSYNVRVFNAYASWKNKKEYSGGKITQWIGREANPDVVCFQEFYHNQRDPYYDMIGKMKSLGYPYYYFYMVLKDKGEGEFGMATFSKYKIENKGDIQFKAKSNNMAIFVDVKIGGETLRIFNVHLESISLDEKNLANLDEEENNYKKLKEGFIKRARQVERILKAAKSAPHKAIICGDWNDLPYSYSYQMMKKYYDNAFEEAGDGFGFTFNGRMKFLRIDNQFYNKTIRLKRFDTFSNIRHSDHFPIMARYNLD
jgi:endonuclease/exonuclease/phosphatase family metal-dependent hydrolase